MNFDTSRMFVAQELGFGGIAENSLDAVSNRDFVLDYLSAAATCATHLSQLGAEIVLWSSEEFGFCEVADRFASGSSLMPQKKNPDAAELLRAKAPRVAGPAGHAPRRAPRPAAHLQQGPPGGQGAALRRHRHASSCASRWPTRCSPGITFDRERLAAAASDEFLAATDVADLLVKRGVPFREAHGIVGGLVRGAVEQGKPLSELTRGGAGRAGARAGRPEFYELLARRGAGSSRRCPRAAPSLARVRDQLGQARARPRPE